MKHMRRLIQISVFAFTFTSTSISYAGIANTVHNMSTSGAGAIKATTETEICVFCHIPHSAPSVGRPLWNHDMPATGYTMYSSDYLTRAGYPVPTGLGTTTGTPGMLSRQCLSCHDGTIAVGAVYAVRGTILGAGLIAMSGVSGSGTMLTTATGFIGGPAGQLGDLTRHHPVGIAYNSAITIAFGSGSRTIELVSPITSAAVKLYNISGANYVECASCHDPHIQNQKFLRDTTGSTLAGKIGNTCGACHNKTGWTGSIHQTASNTYSDAAVNTTFGANTISSLVCMNCHRTHKSPLGAPYLTRQAEETTCFQGASGLATETACHGSSSSATTNRIQTAITRAYKHPTTTISGVHTDLDVLYPLATGKGLDWATSRHAECVDCHNPHRAANTPARVAATAWYPATVAITSNQTSNSGALTGVSGVQPTAWPALWTVPVTFTTQESSTYEYQICFKCHSYYALQAASGISAFTTASGIAATDQAMEFNPNNKSAHPVAVTLNNQTGSYAPKPLAATQMSTPWTAVGNQTMYCSDCHGTDNEASGDPKGPHGSSYKYYLKGTGRYWPTNAANALYTLGNNDATDAGIAGLFCRNCHPLRAATSNTWYNNVHLEHSGPQLGNVPCVACHLVVPHGGKRSRLIGYASDISPYNYNGAGTYQKLELSGFKKAATPTGYSTSDCYSTVSGCTTHGAITGADP